MLINDSSDSIHSSTFTALVVATFTKKEERERQGQKAKLTHNLLLRIVEFVWELYLFHASCIYRFMESRNLHHKYC